MKQQVHVVSLFNQQSPHNTILIGREDKQLDIGWVVLYWNANQFTFVVAFTAKNV